MALYLGDKRVTSTNISGGSDKVVINRVVSPTGVYQMPTSSFTFSLPSNATDMGSYAMYYAFRNCTGLTSVDLSSLTTISGSGAMYYAFYNCTGLTSVDLSSLTTLSGSQGMSQAFQNCTGLTSVDLSSLTTISGSGAMSYAFGGCTKLTSLSFPALTSTSFGSYTNQFNGMLYGVTGCTVHFPSNLQSVIGSWSSVTAGFGGTNTTVLFDLPSTDLVNLTVNLQGTGNHALSAFTINGTTYTISNFTMSDPFYSMTIAIPKNTNLSWTATAYASFSVSPSSGTVNLSQDGSLTISIAGNTGGGGGAIK